jgi:hypothetical protein
VEFAVFIGPSAHSRKIAIVNKSPSPVALGKKMQTTYIRTVPRTAAVEHNVGGVVCRKQAAEPLAQSFRICR